MTPVFVDAALKVTVILAAALTAAALLRTRPAALRHWVLAVAIAAAALAPVASTVLPGWRIELGWLASNRASGSGELQAVVDEALAIQPIATGLSTRGDAVAGSVSTAAVLAGVWLGGAGLLLSVLAFGLARLAWLASRCRRVTTGRLAATASDIAGTYGIRRPVCLLESEHPTLLATWGAWRPRIVLPAGASRWDDERARTVLAHELAHVARHDWAIQMLAEVVRSIHWLNPLAWLACRRLRHESERTCDDFVLRAGVSGCDYAAHLVDLAREFRRARRPILPVLAMARPSGLERRVLAMVNRGLDHGPASRNARLVALIAGMVVALPILAAETANGTDAMLTGRVFDQMNLPVPGAKVAATHDASDKIWETRTDAEGVYRLTGIPDGTYDVRASYPGLKTSVVTGARAESGDVDFTLAIGALTETMTVVGLPGGSATASGPRQERAPRDWTTYISSCTESHPGGGNVKEPRKVRDVRPAYPPHLAGERVQGIVILEGLVSAGGVIEDLKVLREAHPDLDAAALDAVGQWEFTPTLLDCRPVEVVITVTVNFQAGN